MNLFKQIFWDHKWAIFLALLVSIIVATPQVYFRIEHRNDGLYQGIELLPDSPRSALTREVLDGHPSVANVYYKDGKDGPYLWQPLQPMVVGYLGKIFSLDINNTILLSRLVLPFILFLLIYIFVLLFSGGKLAALSSSTVLLLAETVTTFSGASKLLHGLSPGNFLQLSRPVNPAMTYIPLFAFLVVFWLFYKKRNWYYGVASAILLGLNFYTYFYTWTFLYAFGGVLILALLLQKKQYEATRIISVFVGALLIAIPYFINLYHAMLSPTYEEASARFGVVLSHTPLFVGVTVIITIIIFFLWFPREDKERYFFGLALLLTAFVVQNQQILTGRVMQPDHYHWFFIKPMAIIIVLLVIFHFLSSRGLDFYKKFLAIIIIVMSVYVGVFTQVISYVSDRRDGGNIAIERQKYGLVMRWLSDNAPKEAVVFANDEASHLTVIYTPLNVFYHRVAMNSLTATKTRLLDVLFTFYRLRGVTAEEAEEMFFKERYYLSWSIYGIYYRELLGSYGAIPDEKVEEIIVLYKKTFSLPADKWLEKIWRKYEVEYLVWDKKNNPEWRLDKYSFLRKVAVFDNLVIYNLLP